MSFNVRVWGHRGTSQIKQVNPSQFTSNIQETLYEPYEWGQLVTTNGATPVATTPVPGDLATIVYIEIPDAQSVRYELNTLGRTGGPVNAGNQSKRLSGIMIFTWTAGSTLSFVEAAPFP